LISTISSVRVIRWNATVDDSSLPEVVERDLRPDEPAGRDQPAGDRIRHGRMPARQQPSEVAAAPAGLEDEADFENRRDPAERCERAGIEVSSLDLREGAPRDVRPSCHILLAPAPANSDLTKHPAEGDALHPVTMARPAYRPLIGRRRDGRKQNIWSNWPVRATLLGP
jgi:hypothetical protein